MPLTDDAIVGMLQDPGFSEQAFACALGEFSYQELKAKIPTFFLEAALYNNLRALRYLATRLRSLLLPEEWLPIVDLALRKLGILTQPGEKVEEIRACYKLLASLGANPNESTWNENQPGSAYIPSLIYDLTQSNREDLLSIVFEIFAGQLVIVHCRKDGILSGRSVDLSDPLFVAVAKGFRGVLALLLGAIEMRKLIVIHANYKRPDSPRVTDVTQDALKDFIGSSIIPGIAMVQQWKDEYTDSTVRGLIAKLGDFYDRELDKHIPRLKEVEKFSRPKVRRKIRAITRHHPSLPESETSVVSVFLHLSPEFILLAEKVASNVKSYADDIQLELSNWVISAEIGAEKVNQFSYSAYLHCLMATLSLIFCVEDANEFYRTLVSKVSTPSPAFRFNSTFRNIEEEVTEIQKKMTDNPYYNYHLIILNLLSVFIGALLAGVLENGGMLIGIYEYRFYFLKAHFLQCLMSLLVENEIAYQVAESLKNALCQKFVGPLMLAVSDSVARYIMSSGILSWSMITDDDIPDRADIIKQIYSTAMHPPPYSSIFAYILGETDEDKMPLSIMEYLPLATERHKIEFIANLLVRTEEGSERAHLFISRYLNEIIDSVTLIPSNFVLQLMEELRKIKLPQLEPLSLPVFTLWLKALLLLKPELLVVRIANRTFLRLLLTLTFLTDEQKNAVTEAVQETQQKIVLKAIRENNFELVTAFHQIGEKFELKDEVGNNVLHVALQLGFYDLFIELFRFNPALLHSPNLEGKTPLMLILQLGDDEAISLLNGLVHAGDISQPRRRGGHRRRTLPFLYIIQQLDVGSYNILVVLIENKRARLLSHLLDLVGGRLPKSMLIAAQSQCMDNPEILEAINKILADREGAATELGKEAPSEEKPSEGSREESGGEEVREVSSNPVQEAWLKLYGHPVTGKEWWNLYIVRLYEMLTLTPPAKASRHTALKEAFGKTVYKGINLNYVIEDLYTQIPHAVPDQDLWQVLEELFRALPVDRASSLSASSGMSPSLRSKVPSAAALSEEVLARSYRERSDSTESSRSEEAGEAATGGAAVAAGAAVGGAGGRRRDVSGTGEGAIVFSGGRIETGRLPPSGIRLFGFSPDAPLLIENKDKLIAAIRAQNPPSALFYLITCFNRLCKANREFDNKAILTSMRDVLVHQFPLFLTTEVVTEEDRKWIRLKCLAEWVNENLPALFVGSQETIRGLVAEFERLLGGARFPQQPDGNLKIPRAVLEPYLLYSLRGLGGERVAESDKKMLMPCEAMIG